MKIRKCTARWTITGKGHMAGDNCSYVAEALVQFGFGQMIALPMCSLHATETTNLFGSLIIHTYYFDPLNPPPRALEEEQDI